MKQVASTEYFSFYEIKLLLLWKIVLVHENIKADC